MYQQLGILQFTATFIKDCALYFRIKTLYLVPPGFLKLLELPVRLQTNVSIDYIVDLPKCLYNGKIYRYIFIIINRLIKIRYFISITSLNIEELIKVFIYTIYKLYGALNTIISNRGSLFVSDFQRYLNSNQKLYTVYIVRALQVTQAALKYQTSLIKYISNQVFYSLRLPL